MANQKIAIPAALVVFTALGTSTLDTPGNDEVDVLKASPAVLYHKTDRAYSADMCPDKRRRASELIAASPTG